MGQQIIQQPDGRYALWSTVVDNFILRDVTPDQIIAYRVARARHEIETEVRNTVAELASGGKPYFQFTMTWEEACRWRDEVRAPADAEES